MFVFSHTRRPATRTRAAAAREAGRHVHSRPRLGQCLMVVSPFLLTPGRIVRDCAREGDKREGRAHRTRTHKVLNNTHTNSQTHGTAHA